METLLDCLLNVKNLEDRGIYIKRSLNDVHFISYKLFFQMALKTGEWLRKKGFKKSDELIIAIQNTQNFLFVFWGCIVSGVCAVPFKISDENLESLPNILAICQKPRIVTDNETLATKIREQFGCDVLAYSDTLESADKHTAIEPMPFVSKNDIAYVQFSSGSTNNVKGVGTTHKMLLACINAFNDTFHIHVGDRMLSWMPLYHNMGLIAGHLIPLQNGINQYLIPTEIFMQDAMLWGQSCSEDRITLALVTNFALHYFVKAYYSANQKFAWDFSHMRKVLNGGEPISGELCDQFFYEMRQYGMIDDQILSPGYGMAETTLAITYTPQNMVAKVLHVQTNSLHIGGNLQFCDKCCATGHSTFMSVGAPIASVQMRLVDLDGHTIGEDSVGVIQVKGDCVISEYYRSKIMDSFENGWFNTGDLGFMHEGLLYITGRYKNMFLYNGKNYYSNDVEEYIYKTNPKYRENVYIVGYRKRSDDLNDSVLGFILCNDMLSCAAEARHIIRTVHSGLGIHIEQMVPVSDFPKTVSGKIKRYDLKDAYLDGKYDDAVIQLRQLMKDKNENAEDDIESFLLGIIQEYARAGADLEQNFISMGLSSVQISKIFIKIDSRFPGILTVSDLFDYSNIELLAAYIGKKLGDVKTEKE